MTGRGRRRAADEQRLRQLLEDHHEAILRFFARRLDPASIDDATAAVFETAWRRIEDVPLGDASGAWLYGVARNTLRHEQRSWTRRRNLDERIARESPRPGDADPADAIAEVDRIRRAAAHLNEPDRELLELISWEQLGPAELATVLGCSVNAATIRVHRMRKALLHHLDESNSEELTR